MIKMIVPLLVAFAPPIEESAIVILEEVGGSLWTPRHTPSSMWSDIFHALYGLAVGSPAPVSISPFYRFYPESMHPLPPPPPPGGGVLLASPSPAPSPDTKELVLQMFRGTGVTAPDINDLQVALDYNIEILRVWLGQRADLPTRFPLFDLQDRLEASANEEGWVGFFEKPSCYYFDEKLQIACTGTQICNAWNSLGLQEFLTVNGLSSVPLIECGSSRNTPTWKPLQPSREPLPSPPLYVEETA